MEFSKKELSRILHNARHEYLSNKPSVYPLDNLLDDPSNIVDTIQSKEYNINYAMASPIENDHEDQFKNL